MLKNNINMKGDKPKNKVKRTQIQRSENYIKSDVKLINPNPTFYITVKVILKQMKHHIEEFEEATGVPDFKAIVGSQVRIKLMEILKGKGYMKSANITNLFREIHPRSNDRDFIKGIAEYTIKEKKDSNQTEYKTPNSLISTV